MDGVREVRTEQRIGGRGKGGIEEGMKGRCEGEKEGQRDGETE